MVRGRGLKTFLLGFGLGSIYDLAGVLFVQAINSKATGLAAVVSMGLGCLSLSGIETALKNRWGLAGVILGYGVGTFVAVQWFSP